MKRTPAEKQAFVQLMGQLKATPGWGLYVNEVTRLREVILKSMYKEKGEDLAKVAGIMRGIDLCLNVEDLA